MLGTKVLITVLITVPCTRGTRQASNSTKKLNKLDVPVVWINLDDARQRRFAMQAELRHLKAKVIRVRAVTRSDVLAKVREGTFLPNLSPLQDDQARQAAARKLPTSVLGEMGCVLSHLRAIELAYSSGFDRVLVLEDDVSLQYVRSWRRSLGRILDAAPTGWQLVQLFTVNTALMAASCSTTQADFLRWNDHDCWSTGAYALSRAGMEQIVTSSRDGDGPLLWSNQTRPVAFRRNGFGNIADHTFGRMTSNAAYVYSNPLFTLTGQAAASQVDTRVTSGSVPIGAQPAVAKPATAGTAYVSGLQRFVDCYYGTGGQCPLIATEKARYLLQNKSESTKFLRPELRTKFLSVARISAASKERACRY